MNATFVQNRITSRGLGSECLWNLTHGEGALLGISRYNQEPDSPAGRLQALLAFPQQGYGLSLSCFFLFNASTFLIILFQGKECFAVYLWPLAKYCGGAFK